MNTAQCKGSTRFGAFLPEDRGRAGFHAMFFKKQDGRQSSKEETVSVHSICSMNIFYLFTFMFIKLDVCSERKFLYYFCYTYLLLRMALHWKRTGTMQRRKCTNYC